MIMWGPPRNKRYRSGHHGRLYIDVLTAVGVPRTERPFSKRVCILSLACLLVMQPQNPAKELLAVKRV
jgi:hypothetical protein